VKRKGEGECSVCVCSLLPVSNKNMSLLNVKSVRFNSWFIVTVVYSDDAEGREMEIHETIDPKFGIFSIMETPLQWGYRPVSFIFRKLISATTFCLVCLYLEPFRSYLALKLTVFENIQKIQHIILPFGEATGGLRPRTIHFRSPFHAQQLRRRPDSMPLSQVA